MGLAAVRAAQHAAGQRASGRLGVEDLDHRPSRQAAAWPPCPGRGQLVLQPGTRRLPAQPGRPDHPGHGTEPTQMPPSARQPLVTATRGDHRHVPRRPSRQQQRRRPVLHAAGLVVRRPVPLRGGGRASRNSAASTATAAGSSMRSGKPCPARERRASSAPACRIAARSWSLSGCRAVSPGVLVPSARPAAGVRASRADARAGPGTGPPPGRSLTRTAPGPAHPPASPADPDRAARAGVPPPVPVKPGARPPGHARQSGDVRPALGGLAGRQPWRGAGCVPARAQVPANRQARYRPRAHQAGPPGR